MEKPSGGDLHKLNTSQSHSQGQVGAKLVLRSFWYLLHSLIRYHQPYFSLISILGCLWLQPCLDNEWNTVFYRTYFVHTFRLDRYSIL